MYYILEENTEKWHDMNCSPLKFFACLKRLELMTYAFMAYEAFLIQEVWYDKGLLEIGIHWGC